MAVEPIRNKKEIQRFLKYLKVDTYKDKRNWLLAKFMLNTRLRVSDVVGLLYKDIFTEKKNFRNYLVIHEKKTGKEKKIKLNNSLKSDIKAYAKEFKLHSNDYIFKSRKRGYHISTTQAYRKLKKAANAVGIDNFGCHSLRKTWGFWTYKASRYNIALIMDVFNHSSEKITLRYIGISQEQKDELYSLVQF